MIRPIHVPREFVAHRDLPIGMIEKHDRDFTDDQILHRIHKSLEPYGILLSLRRFEHGVKCGVGVSAVVAATGCRMVTIAQLVYRVIDIRNPVQQGRLVVLLSTHLRESRCRNLVRTARKSLGLPLDAWPEIIQAMRDQFEAVCDEFGLSGQYALDVLNVLTSTSGDYGHGKD